MEKMFLLTAFKQLAYSLSSVILNNYINDNNYINFFELSCLSFQMNKFFIIISDE